MTCVCLTCFFGGVMGSSFLTWQVFCTRERLFIKAWQLDVYHGFSVFYFVSVTLIIIFTYISIMITACAGLCCCTSFSYACVSV